RQVLRVEELDEVAGDAVALGLGGLHHLLGDPRDGMLAEAPVDEARNLERVLAGTGEEHEELARPRRERQAHGRGRYRKAGPAHSGAAAGCRGRSPLTRARVPCAAPEPPGCAGSMKETVERESKLTPGEGFVLRELGGEPQPTRVFVSPYHDTPDPVLARHGA